MMNMKNAKKGALDIIIKLGNGGAGKGPMNDTEHEGSKETTKVAEILKMHDITKMSDEDIVSLHDSVCKELTSRGLMDEEGESEDENTSADTSEDYAEGEKD